MWFRYIMETIGSENLTLRYIGCALAGEKPGDNVVFNPLMHTDHLLLAYYSVNSIMDISSGGRGAPPIPTHMTDPTAINLLEAAIRAVVSGRYGSDGRENQETPLLVAGDIVDSVAIPVVSC